MVSQVKVRLGVEVATNDQGTCGTWRPCPKLAAAAGSAYVASWGELLTVLEQTGRLVGAQIPKIGTHAFRVTAHHEFVDGGLFGLAEWRISSETGRWLPVLAWTAGEHAAYAGRIA